MGGGGVTEKAETCKSRPEAERRVGKEATWLSTEEEQVSTPRDRKSRAQGSSVSGKEGNGRAGHSDSVFFPSLKVYLFT